MTEEDIERLALEHTPLTPEHLNRLLVADVIFVCQDGYALAPARVRAYSFASHLESRGIRTAVLSTRDHLGAPSHCGAVDDMSNPLKLFYSGLVGMLLLRNPRALIYMQKATYPALGVLSALADQPERLVLDYDDFDFQCPAFRDMESWLPDLGPNEFSATLASKACACFVSSNRLKELLSQVNPTCHLLPTGVDAERFNPALCSPTRSKDRIDLIWAGTVWSAEIVKDLALMIQGFLLLPQATRDRMRLNLIGGGLFWDEFSGMVRKVLGSGPHLVIRDFVPPEEMPAILAKMDVGLLPLRDTLFNQCKSPTKLFEYLAMGCVVCASPVGEVHHILRHGENGLLADTPEDWARNLALCIENEPARMSLARQALADCQQNWTLEQIGDRLHDLLIPLLNHRAAS